VPRPQVTTRPLRLQLPAVVAADRKRTLDGSMSVRVAVAGEGPALVTAIA
jgi:hypothetical protein